MNYDYPMVDRMTDQNSTIRSETHHMKDVLSQFFAFYGNKFDMLHHIISANIGQWQEKRSPSERFVCIFLTFIQFENISFSQNLLFDSFYRLRSAINTSPENWENCPMFVQDLVRSNINITTEIPKQTAANFQQMCKRFAKELS